MSVCSRPVEKHTQLQENFLQLFVSHASFTPALTQWDSPRKMFGCAAMITCPLVDGPSGRFAQAACQTNDDGIDTIHQQRSGINLASRNNLLRLKRSWPVGVAGLLCRIPVANDRSGFSCLKLTDTSTKLSVYICFQRRVQIIFSHVWEQQRAPFLEQTSTWRS